MGKPRRVTSVALALVFSFGLLSSVSCTKYASPEDLQNLDNARKAAVAAEKELDRVKAERSDVEKELAGKEAELAAAKEELELVKQRLETYRIDHPVEEEPEQIEGGE
ncbi:hypothetical protein K9N50_04060 [bacterium]|nr:hypothetical protein [bacterium]